MMMLLAISSCKDTKIESEKVVTSEINQEKENFELKEYSLDSILKMINQKNDTIYIANFFATWCGPCVREIPHFRATMEQNKNQPVKFIFINVDEAKDWNTVVKDFVKEKGIAQQTILLDASTLKPEVLQKHFQKWDGSSIPFTFMRRGNNTDETVGMLQKYDLDRKIESL